MSTIRLRGEDIRRFILKSVEKHPSDLNKRVAEKFGITRQAVNKHLQRLVEEKVLQEAGKTKGRIYKLRPLTTWTKSYQITSDLAEDLVWSNDIREAVGQLSDNVLNICHYGFTEMFNNAIDHSGGTQIDVYVEKTAVDTEIFIDDNGVGIFKKIQNALGLVDERHALLELHKGKLTTDPQHHSGEGIFFTSRMFDLFNIHAGDVYFAHEFGQSEDWLLEHEKHSGGTTVGMKIHNHTSRTSRKIFDQFASGDDYGFNKTVVPVRLAKYGNDQLISRSQAKRLLARIELFEIVMFDFNGVDLIGQAFADEIFRVFAKQHPKIELIPIHENAQIKRMIDRAKAVNL